MRALSGTAARIAVSSYYAYKKRQRSARARRDQALMVVIQDVYEANYSCYGVRKMWKAINRGYADQFGSVARCTVERLMAQLGIDGIRRRRKRPKTASARAGDCPDDLVDREFTAAGPNCLWVADITYVPTQAGWVYAMFILDVFTREIVGWQVTNHLRESLARDALTMALAAKFRAGEDVSGLVHHSDRGVQGGFNWSSQHLEYGGGQQWRRRTGLPRPAMCPRACDGSGGRIEHCGPRCGRRDVPSPHGRCSVSSGG
ncbi:IS3 family transposase [Brevibacterium sp. NPDC059310]|uniref:IS3 family transposase n=1 Tax=Brevibacterium sp. NPDC059310 TaxID=3346802 RepID=UPI0036727805